MDLIIQVFHIYIHARDYNWRKKNRQLGCMVSLGFISTQLSRASLLILSDDLASYFTQKREALGRAHP